MDSDELEFIVNEEMQQYQILHEAVIIQQNKELHENRTIVDNEDDIATIQEIEDKYKHGFKNGYWRPETCKPRSNLAIMIAYRNRERNMRIMLPYLIELLQKQLQNTVRIVSK